MAETPRRDVRIADELWEPLTHTAKAMGTNNSALLRLILTSWVTGHPAPAPSTKDTHS
jgi:hypothetical protein